MKPTVFNYADHERLQSELERVKSERDAAVRCIEGINEALKFQRYSAIWLRIFEWRSATQQGNVRRIEL